MRSWSVIIEIGILLYIACIYVLNNQLKFMACSFLRRQQPNTIDYQWWFTLVKNSKGMQYLLVLYVVLKVTTSSNSRYARLALLLIQNIFLATPSSSDSMAKKNSRSFNFLSKYAKLVSRPTQTSILFKYSPQQFGWIHLFFQISDYDFHASFLPSNVKFERPTHFEHASHESQQIIFSSKDIPFKNLKFIFLIELAISIL